MSIIIYTNSHDSVNIIKNCKRHIIAYNGSIVKLYYGYNIITVYIFKRSYIYNLFKSFGILLLTLLQNIFSKIHTFCV